MQSYQLGNLLSSTCLNPFQFTVFHDFRKYATYVAEENADEYRS